MNVLFISPHYPLEMQDFTRGLAEVGARVYGMSSDDPGQVPSVMGRYLSGYLRTNLTDTAAVVRDVRAAWGHIRFDRIECLWEPFVVLAAELREALGVPGMSVDVVRGFRDKELMKQRIEAAGVRVPRHARVTTADGARTAAEKIGFPVVVKPIAGAGTADTYGVGSARELEDILQRTRHVGELSVEEYIDGEEFTYDAVVLDGKPVFESVAQYFPKPLESRNIEWISPAQIVYRDPHVPELSGGIEMGRNVLIALGMGTGFVHMEWFKKPDGEVVFGEIAARAGGAKLVDQMNFANDFDVYREWARVVMHGRLEEQPGRRHHVAVVFKRAQGQGRIVHVDGLDELRRFCGQDLVLEHLLPLGHPRRNWKQTLLSDGYVLMRHPELDRCLEMMKYAIVHLKLYAA